MAIRTATRSQLLMALRRWKPTMSLRRLGDVLNCAKQITLEGSAKSETTAAFGLVLDGMLQVSVEGAATHWVGPGEIFGMTQYELRGINSPMLLAAHTQTVRYLIFSQDELATLRFARLPPPPV